jgi:O-antigen/teichoic acid export membrane protein
MNARLSSVLPSRSFLQMISSAMLSQGLLSAGNFAVGLMLIRRTPHDQYGYYVLIVTAVQLMTQLQIAFIQPSMVRRVAAGARSDRRDFVGGAYREQRRRALLAAAVGGAVLSILWYTNTLSTPLTLIGLASIFAILATLYREYFRMVLLAYRIPLKALQVDIFYVAVLCAGAYLATLSGQPAMVAALTLGLSAAVGGWLLSRMVWNHEGWEVNGAPEVFTEMAPFGTWAVIGAAIHWTFAQGFIYIVAGRLGVTAVATISATRLLLMPVNLMASGLGSMTFPTVSRWLQRLPVNEVFKRLSLLAAGIAALGGLYELVMWVFRDWIFTHVTKGHFEHRDTLLLLWSAVFLLMAVRDQMLYLPAACGRYRIMAWLTLATAIISLVTCYVCVWQFGVVGALIGVLAGEAFNILGFVFLSLREIALARADAPTTEAVQ